MFGFSKKDKEIKSLRCEIQTLEYKLIEKTEDAKAYAGMADQRMQTITALNDRIKEAEDERDTMAETLDQLENGAEELQARYATLEAENTQLRDGAGHALHALAAVQDLSTAFVKRIDMLPPYCGLPQDLVQSVFSDFETGIEDRKELKKQIERGSWTTERDSDEAGTLFKPLTIDEINQVLFGDASDVKRPENIEIEYNTETTNITELGLYTIELDLGCSIQSKAKLWVVPTAENPEPSSNEIYKP